MPAGSSVAVTAGTDEKMDLLVTITACDACDACEDGPEVNFRSPVRDLFRQAQDRAVRQVLKEYTGLWGVKIMIEDRQAFDFVIRARIRSALELFYSGREGV